MHTCFKDIVYVKENMCELRATCYLTTFSIRQSDKREIDYEGGRKWRDSDLRNLRHQNTAQPSSKVMLFMGLSHQGNRAWLSVTQNN